MQSENEAKSPDKSNLRRFILKENFQIEFQNQYDPALISSKSTSPAQIIGRNGLIIGF
jgi:hypothetical protein